MAKTEFPDLMELESPRRTEFKLYAFIFEIDKSKSELDQTTLAV